MRNYFAVLRQKRTAAPAEISEAVASLTAEELADEDDLDLILTKAEWKTHYTRLHLQYEAMAAALVHPGTRMPVQDHQWEKRLVEFEVEQDTLEFDTRPEEEQ